MGIINNIFKPKNTEHSNIQRINNYFKLFNAYSPTFTSFDGGVYEMDLTRAAIDAFARHCAKLKPEIQGTAYKRLEKTLQFKPNKYMDTYKFIYRIATILATNNTAFIIPIFADDEETVIGLYPLPPTSATLMEVKGVEYIKYRFANGEVAVMELEKVGIMNNFYYKNDFFGETNSAINPTLRLLDTQNQGIIEGVKQSAAIRFMAQLASVLRPEDIEKEKKRFTEDNLSFENHSGVMMFDGKYKEIKQIDSKPFIADDKQMTTIKNNVFNYFGVSEAILQNRYSEEEWNAFYEGKIEPFAIQLSLVITNMLFNTHERAYGNQVIFSANRLQYASNATKLNVSTQMFDRGVMTQNMINDIWNLPHVEGGDKRYIRKEYAEINELNNSEVVLEEVESEGEKDASKN